MRKPKLSSARETRMDKPLCKLCGDPKKRSKMTKFKRGDRVLYRGTFNEILEESTAKVLSVNRENGLLFIEVDFPVENESGNSCDQWVHPCQCRKLKLTKKSHSKGELLKKLFISKLPRLKSLARRLRSLRKLR